VPFGILFLRRGWHG